MEVNEEASTSKKKSTRNQLFEMDSEKGVNSIAGRKPARRNRPLAIGFLSVAFCYLLHSTLSFGNLTSWITLGCHSKRSSNTWQAPITSKALVPLEAHIMSKCPDARDCLRDLILPTMQRTFDKVNFTLSYIGT